MHRATGLTLEKVSQKVDALAAKLERTGASIAISPTWWQDQAGRFENDPVFDEIVRFGRQARRSSSAALKKNRARS